MHLTLKVFELLLPAWGSQVMCQGWGLGWGRGSEDSFPPSPGQREQGCSLRPGSPLTNLNPLQPQSQWQPGAGGPRREVTAVIRSGSGNRGRRQVFDLSEFQLLVLKPTPSLTLRSAGLWPNCAAVRGLHFSLS